MAATHVIFSFTPRQFLVPRWLTIDEFCGSSSTSRVLFTDWSIDSSTQSPVSPMTLAGDSTLTASFACLAGVWLGVDFADVSSTNGSPVESSRKPEMPCEICDSSLWLLDCPGGGELSSFIFAGVAWGVASGIVGDSPSFSGVPALPWDNFGFLSTFFFFLGGRPPETHPIRYKLSSNRNCKTYTIQCILASQ